MADYEMSPFDELARIQDRVDRMVRGLSAVTGMNMDMPDMDIGQQDSDIIVTVDLPRVDIRQQDGDILMTVDLPGVDEKDIDVDLLDERILEITARKKQREGREGRSGVLRPGARVHVLLPLNCITGARRHDEGDLRWRRAYPDTVREEESGWGDR